MEEKKEKTFEDIKEDLVANGVVSDEQERLIIEQARREFEFERAKK